MQQHFFSLKYRLLLVVYISKTMQLVLRIW